MANRIRVVRGFIESARRAAARSGKTLTQVLCEIQDAIFNGELREGKILIGSAEAGGSVTFVIPPDHAPLEILALAQEALDRCNRYPDPDNPPRDFRELRRLRVSFRRARIP